ncbi:MAG TPA: response regulator [Bacteroidia bacterium]
MNTSNNVMVFLADSDLLYQETLKNHLQENLKLANIRTFKNTDDLFHQLDQNPDVIVLDHKLNTCCVEDGSSQSILQKIALANPTTRVIILSEQKNLTLIEELRSEGAYACVVRSEKSFERLAELIRLVTPLETEEVQSSFVGNATAWAFLTTAILCMAIYELTKYL